MAKKVTNKDIFANDLFKQAIESADKLNGILQTQLELNTKLLKTSKANLANFEKTAEGVKKLESAANNVNKATENEIRLRKAQKQLDADKARLQKQLIKGTDEEVKGQIRLSEARRVQRKLLKEQVQEEQNLLSASQKLSKQVNIAQKRFKDLAAQYGVNSKQAQAALKEFNKVDDSLREINKAAKDGRRDVGRYSTAFQGLKGVLSKGLGILGITAGVQGLVRAVRGAIGVFTTFEKSLSNLAAVSQATDEEMKALSDTAKELGATTAFTATQVVELQTEFAKLGFPTDDIQQLTGSTLNAAAAMGSGLGETAALVGATLKAFGLDASEAARVNDVLTKSTQASALDFSKLNTAIAQVAPVANSFGFSIEETTSLLGQLANAGFDASTAATSTRNILLNLADANGSLAKSLGGPVTDLPSLVDGLKSLEENGIDLVGALELTDKRSVAAFQTFLKGTDSVLELNEALKESAGTAEETAKKQQDNLAGSLDKLNSAYQGLILSVESGNGAFGSFLRTTVDVATELLSLISGVAKVRDELDEGEKRIRDIANSVITFGKAIVTLTVGFAAYRVGVAASTIVMKAYAVAQKIATVGVKAFNTAMKANIIGLVVSLLASAAAAFGLFSDEADEATESQKEFNDELERTRFLLEKNVEKIRELSFFGKDLSDFTKNELKQAVTELNEELDNLSPSNLFDQQLIEDIKRQINNINKELQNREKSKEDIEKESFEKSLKRQQDQFERERLIITKERDLGIIDEEQYQRRLLELKRKFLIAEFDLREDFNKLTTKQANDLRDKIFEINKELEAKPIKLYDPEQTKKDVDETVGYVLAALRGLDADLEEPSFADKFKQAIVDIQDEVNILADALRQLDEIRAKELSNEISRNDKALAIQEERAQKGLDNELAFRQQKQAELERQQDEQAKKAERRAKILTFFNLLAEYAKENPNSAPAKAFAQTAVAEAIAGSFIEGTKDTVEGDLGSGAKVTNTGVDDYLGQTKSGKLFKFDGQEKIFNPHQSKLIGDLDNDTVAQLAFRHRKGQQSATVVPVFNDQNIVAKLESVEKKLDNIGYNVNWDEHGNVTETSISNGMKKTVKYMKSRPRI